MRIHAFLFLACAAVLASDRQDVPYLVAALDSTDATLVEDAQRRLLVIGPEALPLLRAAAEDELARRGGLLPRIDRLVKELDADDYERREAAERDLVEIGAEALTALRQAADHGEPEQAARAQDALEQIGTGATDPPRFIVQLARAIAAQPDDGCVETLAAIARQPELSIILSAIGGLERLGSPAARRAIAALAADASVDRRWLARAALLRLGEVPSWRLEEVLSDRPADAVLFRMLDAFWSCESPAVVRVSLRAELRDNVTPHVAEMLSGIVDAPRLTREALAVREAPAARWPGLVGLIRDPTQDVSPMVLAAWASADPATRREGALAIARLQPASARRSLEPLLADKDGSVRQAALEALHATVGREPNFFRPALADADLAPWALEAYLVRAPGAEALARIPDRLGGPTTDELHQVERFLATHLDPACKDAVETSAEAPSETKLGAACEAGSSPPPRRSSVPSRRAPPKGTRHSTGSWPFSPSPPPSAPTRSAPRSTTPTRRSARRRSAGPSTKAATVSRTTSTRRSSPRTSTRPTSRGSTSAAIAPRTSSTA